MGNQAPCIARDRPAVVDNCKDEVTRLQKEIAELRSKPACDENVAWLNTIIGELWPKISAFVAKTVKDTVEPQVQAALPGPTQKTFYFEKVTLGQTPLKFGSIHATPENHFGRNGKTRDIALKFDVIYHGDAEVALSALGAKVGIKNIQIQGVMTVVLKELLDQPPFVSGVSVFFANSPRITSEWEGVAGVLGLGVLKHTVRDIVRQQVNNVCVLPKRIAVVLDKSEPRLFRVKAPRPRGCIHLKLCAARKLEWKDMSLLGTAKSDPYVQIRVGAQECRSKTKKKTSDPQWDEEFTFYVFDEEQEISLDIFDEDFGTRDDFLGRLDISVKKLLDTCSREPTWLQLFPDVDECCEKGGKDNGNGEVQLMASWMPVSIDQAKAQAVKVAGPRPQCLLFLGVYSVQVPPEVAGTMYTLEASCNGKSFSVKKASVEQVKDGVSEVQSEKTKGKIAKLRQLGANDADIAMILDIPVEALNERDLAAKAYATEVSFEEPFLWITDVPRETVVDIVVSKGKEKNR